MCASILRHCHTLRWYLAKPAKYLTRIYSLRSTSPSQEFWIARPPLHALTKRRSDVSLPHLELRVQQQQISQWISSPQNVKFLHIIQSPYTLFVSQRTSSMLVELLVKSEKGWDTNSSVSRPLRKPATNNAKLQPSIEPSQLLRTCRLRISTVTEKS
jgi:hypothetical protein